MWTHTDLILLRRCFCHASQWGFIYKRANRRADDSFHADGEQITGNPLQLPSRALIRCHGNKAALLRSDQECAFSPPTANERPPEPN